jgi:undecaprenyl-diphosphatase
MDVEQTIFLGIIQGLTEFLPISSSGHLVIFQHLIGLKNPELLLDISLHVGTLLAVLIFFWADIKMMIHESIGLVGNLFQKQKKFSSKIQQFPHAALIVWIITGTIPTALMGILFSSFVQKMFGSPFFVGFMLIVTGVILGASRLIPDHFTKKRSGATIVCGLFCGLNRELAGRFSFLLSIPAIIGATIVKFDMTTITEIGFIPFFAGIFISFLVGLIALKITMNMVRKGNLYYFSPYCLLAGIVAIFIA